MVRPRILAGEYCSLVWLDLSSWEEVRLWPFIQMEPKLIIIAGDLKGTTFAVRDSIAVGRDPSNQLYLNDPSVSRKHCLIEGAGEQFRIADLDSFNGTFVNGVPVKEHPLVHGDQVSVGDVLLLFLCRDEQAEGGSHRVQLDDKGIVTRSTIRLRREDALYLHPESLPVSGSHLSRAARDLSA